MSESNGDADLKEIVSNMSECSGYEGSLKGAAEHRVCTASEYLLELCQSFLLLLLQMLMTHRKEDKIPVTSVSALIL